MRPAAPVHQQALDCVARLSTVAGRGAAGPGATANCSSRSVPQVWVRRPAARSDCPEHALTSDLHDLGRSSWSALQAWRSIWRAEQGSFRYLGRPDPCRGRAEHAAARCCCSRRPAARLYVWRGVCRREPLCRAGPSRILRTAGSSGLPPRARMTAATHGLAPPRPLPGAPAPAPRAAVADGRRASSWPPAGTSPTCSGSASSAGSAPGRPTTAGCCWASWPPTLAGQLLFNVPQSMWRFSGFGEIKRLTLACAAGRRGQRRGGDGPGAGEDAARGAGAAPGGRADGPEPGAHRLPHAVRACALAHRRQRAARSAARW